MTASAIFAIVTAVGAGLALTGAAISRSAGRWRRTAARAQGTVFRLEMLRPRGTQTAAGSYYAWVRYTTAEGREIEGRTTFASSPPPARQGSTVQVLYHPEHPERVRLDTLMGRGGFAALPCYVLGLVAIVIGIIGLQAS